MSPTPRPLWLRKRRRIDPRWLIALVLLSAAILYLAGNGSVPLWDRDEPRYAQTSRQMLQSGDWVVPRLLDQVRTAKPILIYWLQAMSMKLLGENEFAARLPSAVAMLLTLAILAVVIHRTIGARRALWTALVLASSALVIAAAKLSITDSLLLLWVTVAQVALLCIYAKGSGFRVQGSAMRGPSVLLSVVLWIAVALAGLTKGPVVLGILGMTMIALGLFDRFAGPNRRWRDVVRWWARTRPMLGIVLVALICGPWLYLVERRAPGFISTALWHDVITRSRTGLEGHTAPPGFYLASIWLTYFPWSLLLPAALTFAWRQRPNPIHRFCLAAIIGPWIMFELVQTKLVHYVLPLFPALAFLTADLLVRCARPANGPLKSRAFVIVSRFWFLAVALAGLVPWISAFFFRVPVSAAFAMVLLSILCFAYGRSVYIHFHERRPLEAAAFMGGGMIVIIAVLYGLFFPNAAFLAISPRVAQVLRDEGAVDPGDAITIDYREDSLDFYTDGAVRRERDKLYLLSTPRHEWPRWIVITDAVWSSMPPDTRDEFDEIARVPGWWYNKGRKVQVLVVRKKSPFALRPE